MSSSIWSSKVAPIITGFGPAALVASVLVFGGQEEAQADSFGPELVADVAERVTPAVVNIATQRTARGPGSPLEGHPFFREFFGPRAPRQEMGAGSGVVISSDGYIVTNNHVIEGADRIKVIFANKREYKAKLIGTDKPSDIAVIKIEATGLPHLRFGSSSRLRLGEFVLAIGNPFGVGQTLTMGIVSAKGRANIGIVEYEDFIQTDAAINPGNSGGALVNLKGELVGINTAILSRSGGAQGIGFAVPSDMVRPILDQVRKHGRVRRGWLGVAIQDLTPDLAGALHLEGVEGVLISDVRDDSPAAKANLRAGDVVTNVNGKKTRTSAQLRNKIALLGPGSTAQLSVLRDGKIKNLKVRLGEKKDRGTAREIEREDSGLLSGLTLSELSRDLRGRLEIPRKISGVVVSSIEPGTPAASAGLRPGDVIVEADKRRVRSLKDIDRVRKNKRVLFRVWRQGHFIYVVVRR